MVSQRQTTRAVSDGNTNRKDGTQHNMPLLNPRLSIFNTNEKLTALSVLKAATNPRIGSAGTAVTLEKRPRHGTAAALRATVRAKEVSI